MSDEIKKLEKASQMGSYSSPGYLINGSPLIMEELDLDHIRAKIQTILITHIPNLDPNAPTMSKIVEELAAEQYQVIVELRMALNNDKEIK